MPKVTVVTKTCPFCDQPGTLEVEAAEYDEWKKGKELAQVVFKNLTVDECEQLITGTHVTCGDVYTEDHLETFGPDGI